MNIFCMVMDFVIQTLSFVHEELLHLFVLLLFELPDVECLTHCNCFVLQLVDQFLAFRLLCIVEIQITNFVGSTSALVSSVLGLVFTKPI